MKTYKLLTQTTAVVASAALLLTGCSSAGDSGTSGDAGNKAAQITDVKASDYAPTPYDKVKEGGTLTTATYEIPEQQNVFHADMSGATRPMWNWYNPQVVLYTAEGKYTPNPDYITNVKDEVKDNKTVVTFDINPKATWNDGTPIDWTAFEATWRVNNGKNPDFHVNSTDGYKDIEKVERGENDKQAVVTFDRVYPWWQALFANLAHPALKDVKNFNSYVKQVHPEWGAGPYIPEHVDFNKGEATYVRNPKWWGKKGKLDKRVYRQMKSQAALNAFKNGETDAVGLGDKDRYAALKDMPGIDIRVASMPFIVLNELNSKTPALSDINVRKAVFQAIDRSTLGKIRFNGLPYTETPPGSFIFYPFQKGKYEDNFAKALPETGKDAAVKTLEGAGWAKNDSGIFTKDGKPLSLRYTLFGEDATSQAIAAATQKMLKDAGIDCTIDTHPSSEFSDVVTQKNFDILPLAFSASDPYGAAYFGQTYGSDSQLNLSGTGTKELDKKIKELQELPTAKEQDERSNELEVEALKTFGLQPWANGPDIMAVKKGLVNYGPTGFAVVPVEEIGWLKDA